MRAAAQWQRPARTQADKMQDVDLFLARATDAVVLAADGDDLAARYGVKDTKAVRYKLTIAQQRRRGQ